MRIMAIDYGDARTGVALSDPTGAGVAIVDGHNTHSDHFLGCFNGILS